MACDEDGGGGDGEGEGVGGVDTYSEYLGGGGGVDGCGEGREVDGLRANDEIG